MAKLTYHPEAKAEIKEAAAYYEECRDGLGRRFLAAVEDLVDKILRNPRRCPPISDPFRCCLVKRFPYGVIYSIQKEQIFIAAVMHTKRKPGTWKSRVERP